MARDLLQAMGGGVGTLIMTVCTTMLGVSRRHQAVGIVRKFERDDLLTFFRIQQLPLVFGGPTPGQQAPRWKFVLRLRRQMR